MKKVGVIGHTGRMGRLLEQAITNHADLIKGPGFSRSQEFSLEEVFEKNDYIVDFSQPELIEQILKTALIHSKPLVICTTGWSCAEELLNQVSLKIPLVIASNTSVGAYLQRYLVQHLAKALGEEYDIDISEKHHRQKVDVPSGTAVSLVEEIKAAKQKHQNLEYVESAISKGPRPKNMIAVTAERSGNITGDHEVSFTSLEEVVCIKHQAFDRALFAKGALKIIEWLDNKKPEPGLYGMEDVLDLQVTKKVAIARS